MAEDRDKWYEIVADICSCRNMNACMYVCIVTSYRYITHANTEWTPGEADNS